MLIIVSFVTLMTFSLTLKLFYEIINGTLVNSCELCNFLDINVEYLYFKCITKLVMVVYTFKTNILNCKSCRKILKLEFYLLKYILLLVLFLVHTKFLHIYYIGA